MKTELKLCKKHNQMTNHGCLKCCVEETTKKIFKEIGEIRYDGSSSSGNHIAKQIRKIMKKYLGDEK